MAIPGGSAWAMAQNIASGHQSVTERTFSRMTRGELDKLGFELERVLREVRGDQPPLDDIPALQKRNRRIQRVNSAVMVLRAYRRQHRM